MTHFWTPRGPPLMAEKPENPVEFQGTEFRVLAEKWRGGPPLQGKFGKGRENPLMAEKPKNLTILTVDFFGFGQK